MLLEPHYIGSAGIRHAAITHTAPSEDDYAKTSPKLERALDRLSFRAVLALAAGTAEWIAWRLAEHGPSQDALLWIEAVWAGGIDVRYTRDWDWPAEPKRGPRSGALVTATGLLAEVFRLFRILENGITVQTVYLSHLARHVLPSKPAFDGWLKQCLERLTLLYTRSPEDELGPPVPRTALDPECDFKPTLTNELLAKFLEGLSHDSASNPYLRSPQDMLRLGFPGTPYRI